MPAIESSSVASVLSPAIARPSRGKLLYVITEDWYFCSHVIDRARAAQAQGYEVAVVTRVTNHGENIRAAGLRLIPFPWNRGGLNPLRESATVRALTRLYHAEKPDIVHHIALKPILYGSFAAGRAGVPMVVNSANGLGYTFTSGGWRARLLRPVMMLAFRWLMNPRNSRVLFQNPDDLARMVGAKVVRERDAVLIRGAGVDTERFTPRPEPADGPPLVILVSRMLWDKGIADFVAAAADLRRRGVRARFALVGDTDRQNPNGIPEETCRRWHEAHDVEWWGRREDIPDIIAAAAIVCLPSYGEGLPKVLLEAASSGRPIVATEIPGCREIVRHGENGVLVPARDPRALADAIEKLLANPSLRRQMGERGRQMVLECFSNEHIIAQTLAVYESLLDARSKRTES
jgi:glycosyltransferase involved in cell wall biosynthesis